MLAGKNICPVPLAINIWDAEPASKKKGLNKEDQIQRDTHTHAGGEEGDEGRQTNAATFT